MHARADAREIRKFETWHHRRFAISLAPLALVALVVALAFKRSWTRAGLTGAAFAACVANFTLLTSGLWAGSHGTVPPIVAGWAANAFCAAVIVLGAYAPRTMRANAPPAGPTR